MGFAVLAILCSCSLASSAASLREISDSAQRFADRGRFIDAKCILEAALAEAEKIGGGELATALNNLGAVYWDLGMLRDAKRAYERSLEIRHSMGENDSREVARTLTNLGIVSNDLNDLTQAEESLTRAARLQETLGGPNDPGAAAAWMNLGVSYKAEGRPEQAAAMFRKSLAMDEASGAPAGAALASNNLAVLQMQAGHIDQAEPLLRRAIEIWESGPFPQRLLLASALSNIGSIYTNTNRPEQAEASFERAIRIASLALPPDHPNLAAYRLNYAQLLRKLDRKKEARNLEQTARAALDRHARENFLGHTVDAKQLIK